MAKIIDLIKNIGTIAGILTGPTVGAVLIYLKNMNPIGALICMTLTVWGAAFALYLWRILPMEKKLVKDQKFLYDHEKPDNFYNILEERIKAFEEKLSDKIIREAYEYTYETNLTPLGDLQKHSLMERVNRIEHILRENQLKTKDGKP